MTGNNLHDQGKYLILNPPLLVNTILKIVLTFKTVSKEIKKSQHTQISYHLLINHSMTIILKWHVNLV